MIWVIWTKRLFIVYVIHSLFIIFLRFWSCLACIFLLRLECQTSLVSIERWTTKPNNSLLQWASTPLGRWKVTLPFPVPRFRTSQLKLLYAWNLYALAASLKISGFTPLGVCVPTLVSFLVLVTGGFALGVKHLSLKTASLFAILMLAFNQFRFTWDRYGRIPCNNRRYDC